MRRVGFEPATPWFVARYSIQLSYRRTLMSVITDGTSHFTEIFLKAQGNGEISHATACSGVPANGPEGVKKLPEASLLCNRALPRYNPDNSVLASIGPRQRGFPP